MESSIVSLSTNCCKMTECKVTFSSILSKSVALFSLLPTLPMLNRHPCFQESPRSPSSYIFTFPNDDFDLGPQWVVIIYK